MQPFEVVRTQGSLQYGTLGKSSLSRPQRLQKLLTPDDPHTTSGVRSTSPTRAGGAARPAASTPQPSGSSSSTILGASPSVLNAVNKSSFSSAKKSIVQHSNNSPLRARASSPTRRLAPVPFCQSPTTMKGVVAEETVVKHQSQQQQHQAPLHDGVGTRYHVAHPKGLRLVPPAQQTTVAVGGGPASEDKNLTTTTTATTVLVEPFDQNNDDDDHDAISMRDEGRAGALVSEYFIPVVDFKQLIREQDLEFPLLGLLATTVEIPSIYMPMGAPVAGGSGGAAVASATPFSSTEDEERLSVVVAAKIANIGDSSFTPGALGCILTYVDETFFNICKEGPSAESLNSFLMSSTPRLPLVFVNNNGYLVLRVPQALTGKTGKTNLRFKVVDYASVRRLQDSGETAEFDCSAEVTIEVIIGTDIMSSSPDSLALNVSQADTRRMTKKKKNASSSVRHAEPFTDLVSGHESPFISAPMPAFVPAPCRSLTPLCIHAFRRAPETSPPHALVVNWVKYQPIYFAKCTSLALEVELLQGAQNRSQEEIVQQEDINQAIAALHSAMSRKQSAVDVILPLLDRCTQMLAQLASRDNLMMLAKLVVVRVEVTAVLAGVQLDALRIMAAESAFHHQHGHHRHPPQTSSFSPSSSSSSEAPPFSSAHAPLLVRACVEAGHALKFLGDYRLARIHYRMALAVAESIRHVMGGEESLTPFIRAIADTELLHGDFAAAVGIYERARAMAEMSQKASEIASELPDLDAGALILSCNADVALCQALQRRDEAAQQTFARVEHVMQRLLSSPDRQRYLLLAVESTICGSLIALSRGALQQALALLNKAASFAAEYAEWPDYSAPAAQLVQTNVTTLMQVTHMAMAIAANSSDDREALLNEARSESEKFKCKGEGIAALLLAWVTAVAQFPLDEAPADLSGYDSVLERAGGLVGPESPLFTAMLLCRSVASVDTEPSCSGALAAATTHAVMQLSVAPEHPLRFFFFEALATCFVTRREFRSAVDASYRAAQVWESCKALREERNNATRLVGIGAYAIAYFCHWENSPKGPAGPDAVSVRPTVTTHHPSFTAMVDSVAQASLVDTQSTSFDVLLDAAEVRLCAAEYASALELLGKALRRADSRNVMFLLDGLFATQRSLTRTELDDRSRLLQERRVSSTSLIAVGLVLHEIGLAHEAARSYSKAKASFEQAVAALEMIHAMHHPAAVEMLNGLGRVSLLVGDVGDALLNLEWARDVFCSFHFNCGAYVQDPALVELEEALVQTERAVKTVMASLNYNLLPHESLFSGVAMHV